VVTGAQKGHKFRVKTRFLGWFLWICKRPTANIYCLVADFIELYKPLNQSDPIAMYNPNVLALGHVDGFYLLM